MISEKEANQLGYQPGTVTHADLSAGPDEGSSLPADTVGEVFNVQVGDASAGSLSAALATIVGVPADRYKETVKAKMTMDLQDGGSADVDSNTQFALAKRRRQERGGRKITSWMLEDDYSEIQIVNRPDLTPRQPGLREDEFLTVLAYNPSSAVTVSLANSTVRIPVQTGD